MRSVIKKFSSAAAILVAAFVGTLVLSTVPAAAQQSGANRAAENMSTTGADAAAAQEIDHAKLHDMTNWSKDCITGDDDVRGCVMPYGDIFWLDDTASDGVGVKLYWWDTAGPRHGVCINNQGNGWGAHWARCNKNLPEKHWIKWKVAWYGAEQWWDSEAKYTMI